MTLAIAHAGGAFAGEAYTNSLEALEASYRRGFRVFELDFKRTADGAVACRHDWNAFGGKAPTLAALDARFAGRFTPVNAQSLARFMAVRSDAQLVTDVKEPDQCPVLADLLSAGIPPERTVVQLFDPQEDDIVADLGFPRRSLILYRYAGALHRLNRFIKERRPVAVALSVPQILAGFHDRLEAAPLWAYTVNAPGRARHLRGLGVSGVFTDSLAPGMAGLRE